MAEHEPKVTSLSASTTETPEFTGNRFTIHAYDATSPSWKVQIATSTGDFKDTGITIDEDDKIEQLDYAGRTRTIKVVRTSGDGECDVWPS